MGKIPKLSELDYLFEKGGEVQLSARVYEEKTGVPLPKSKNYLIKNSAFSRWVKEKGYEIVEVQEEPIIEKMVRIRKNEVIK